MCLNLKPWSYKFTVHRSKYAHNKNFPSKKARNAWLKQEIEQQDEQIRSYMEILR